MASLKGITFILLILDCQFGWTGLWHWLLSSFTWDTFYALHSHTYTVTVLTSENYNL